MPNKSKLICMFIGSDEEEHSKAVSENPVAKSKKRKKQSVDIVKPCTDEVIKKRKKKKVIFCNVKLTFS